MDFIMLNSHRLFAIATVRLALQVHVLDPVICLKVFSFSPVDVSDFNSAFFFCLIYCRL